MCGTEMLASRWPEQDRDVVRPAGVHHFSVKSHTAEIEQFAATLTWVPLKGYQVCVQDFDTRDYTLEFQGRSVTVTKEQFDDGTCRRSSGKRFNECEEF
jgi:hypothetical protein